MDIFQLFDQTLEEDQPYVKLICDDLSLQINQNLSQRKPYFFYDTSMILEGLDNLQNNRISDEVLKYFRKRGIKISIANKDIYEQVEASINEPESFYSFVNAQNYKFFLNDIYSSSYLAFRRFNYVINSDYIFEIRLNIRYATEYMKTYV